MEKSQPIEQKVTILFPNNEGQEKAHTFATDDDGFVDFNDVSLGLFEQQSQYVSRYVDGLLDGFPKLGEGLRIKGNSGEYHFMKIHKDDIEEFANRYKEHRKL